MYDSPLFTSGGGGPCLTRRCCTLTAGRSRAYLSRTHTLSCLYNKRNLHNNQGQGHPKKWHVAAMPNYKPKLATHWGMSQILFRFMNPS